jgi:glucose-6-phosphate dehydrogenase assembly protein OpcA
MAATTDMVWSAQGTTPALVEAALRRLLSEACAQNSGCLPARVLNLVCIVDDEWDGEVANRLRSVGRSHPSRTIVCSVHRRKTGIDALATIALPADAAPGGFGLARETVTVDVGEQHLEHLETIVNSLVISDLHTVVWAPHGHLHALERLLGLAQIVLVDSADDPDQEHAVDRACELSERVYVVDLAWLRGAPWRERIAAIFDPPPMRGELRRIEHVEVHFHRSSAISALFIAGWLGSRLGWEPGALEHRGGSYHGAARLPEGEVQLKLTADPAAPAPGLSGITMRIATGRELSLERVAGGLRAHQRDPLHPLRAWTSLTASRSEDEILGEGIRQALLRDPTYQPALRHAQAMLLQSTASRRPGARQRRAPAST